VTSRCGVNDTPRSFGVARNAPITLVEQRADVTDKSPRPSKTVRLPSPCQLVANFFATWRGQSAAWLVVRPSVWIKVRSSTEKQWTASWRLAGRRQAT